MARSRGDDGFLIGELAARTGASRRALRYYEQHGLIRSARSANGYRRYGPEAVETVGRIRSLLGLGLPLAAVEVLLPCALDGRLAFEPCPELRATLRARLDRLDAAAEDLARSRAVVAAALARTESEGRPVGGPVAQWPGAEGAKSGDTATTSRPPTSPRAS